MEEKSSSTNSDAQKDTDDMLEIDENLIALEISLESSIGGNYLPPIKINLSTSLVGASPQVISNEWAEQASVEIKKAVLKIFESKYGRRRTMNFVGTYSDAKESLMRNQDDTADEKSNFQSYDELSKSLAASDSKIENGSMTALVVDDGVMCRKVCGQMLQEVGFSVSYASDGQEAIDNVLIKNNNGSNKVEMKFFDVIMMDNFMPNMDGSDAVTRLRMSGYDGVIIGLTYDMFDESSKQFKESGCTALLSKPLRAQLLKKTLTKIGVSFIDNGKN